MYSMLQGGPRMLGSGGHPQALGPPGPQYPGQTEGPPAPQQGMYGKVFFFHRLDLDHCEYNYCAVLSTVLSLSLFFSSTVILSSLWFHPSSSALQHPHRQPAAPSTPRPQSRTGTSACQSTNPPKTARCVADDMHQLHIYSINSH